MGRKEFSRISLGPFSLLLKPASGHCNLDCSYCFYKDKAPGKGGKRGCMSPAVLEQIIRTYMSTNQPRYVFAWQGGEPALMGVDFYRRVVELQESYAPREAVVINSLQTNATLIDEEMAEHFSDYRFLVGVSLDGPAYMHDLYRTDAGGRGSFMEVMRGINLLRKNKVEMNVLSVVTDTQVHKARELYRFLRDQQFTYHQYIPCVEFEENGNPRPFTVKGEDWGDFLCELYDEWCRWDVQRVSVRLFDSILSRLVNGRPGICHMGSDCRNYFVVEHNGDVYPCDFYVSPELRLGNVMESSWGKMWRSQIYADRRAEDVFACALQPVRVLGTLCR